MSADWIKLRVDLQSHPKTVRILSALGTDKFRVVGGLHAVWSIFDKHTVDGILHGYTPDALDHVIGWPGFAQAVMAVDWLIFDGKDQLQMPEFTEHNGQSAKRRAEDQKRKRNDRRDSETVHELSAPVADNLRTEGGPKADQRKRKSKKLSKSTNVDLHIAFPSLAQLKEIDFSTWPTLPDQATMTQWLKVRKEKGQPPTQIAMNQTADEIHHADDMGISADEVMQYAVGKSWAGIRWKWIEKEIIETGTLAGGETLGSVGCTMLGKYLTYQRDIDAARQRAHA